MASVSFFKARQYHVGMARVHLEQNERVLAEFHPHWLVISGPILLTVLLALGAIGLFSVPNSFVSEDIAPWAIIIPGVFALWAAYRVVLWRSNRWVVTNLRLVDEYGVFRVTHRDTPLHKIQSISYSQSVLGRILRFGDARVQTAADQGDSDIRMVARPGALKSIIFRAQDGRNESDLPSGT
jgi:uncharacterized membrane protein YdbT with pleckstrin-like domain